MVNSGDFTDDHVEIMEGLCKELDISASVEMVEDKSLNGLAVVYTEKDKDNFKLEFNPKYLSEEAMRHELGHIKFIKDYELLHNMLYMLSRPYRFLKYRLGGVSGTNLYSAGVLSAIMLSKPLLQGYTPLMLFGFVPFFAYFSEEFAANILAVGENKSMKKIFGYFKRLYLDSLLLKR